jgi:hypothetical protein
MKREGAIDGWRQLALIPSNQPLARLAFYLIEPESDDGLVT